MKYFIEVGNERSTRKSEISENIYKKLISAGDLFAHSLHDNFSVETVSGKVTVNKKTTTFIDVYKEKIHIK